MGTDENPNRTPLELRAFIDSMLAFGWSTRPDGFPEFVNQRLHPTVAEYLPTVLSKLEPFA